MGGERKKKTVAGARTRVLNLKDTQAIWTSGLFLLVCEKTSQYIQPMHT